MLEASKQIKKIEEALSDMDVQKIELKTDRTYSNKPIYEVTVQFMEEHRLPEGVHDVKPTPHSFSPN